MRIPLRWHALTAALAALPGVGYGAGVQTLDVVEVVDSAGNLVGIADSANQGTVPHMQLEARPKYRPGELLETTPGLIVTQHSGEGKANQYFLRGVNLDHGTDLAIFVDDMPVNLRTHAHGQGYSDLNFFIPELASRLQYRKGPYYAEEGDFAAAGAIHIDYFDRLPENIAEVAGGNFGVARGLVAGSRAAGAGNLLYAVELFHNDGPWTRPDDFQKGNAVLRYSQGTAANGFSVTGMAYRGKWNSTDQIARRAVDSGLVGRFDALDPSDGGEARRYSLSGKWQQTGSSSISKANAFVVKSDLKLYSNFTYFLDDPVNGDQFLQRDHRILTGLNASYTGFGKWFGHEFENTIGAQFRNDNIQVGLFGTRARQVLSTTRDDHVVETSAALYFQNSLRWTEGFRTIVGVRGDYYRGDVASNIAANSGSVSDHLVSPKLSLIFGPWAKTEVYLNYGRGFHSNDVRGTTITVDPKTGEPADKVPLLVKTRGYEAGMRTALVPHLQSALALFRLDFDSEIIFQGDAGTTAPSRSSRRVGFEFSNFWTPTSWLLMDADIAYTRARFTAPDPNPPVAGDRIPGAVEGVASLGASVDHLGPYYGALQLRYFGPRPLIEDNSVRSKSTTLVSARAGYKFAKNLRAQVDVFNLFNRSTSQIDYYYTSRLPGEAPEGVNDGHFHPVEPRSFRLTLIANF